MTEPDTTPAAEPEVARADLAQTIHHAIQCPEVYAQFGEDYDPADWSRDAVMNVLRDGGWIIDGVPPVKQVLADGREFYDQLVLTKLVVRFFRVMILSAVVIPETPAAMEWLKDYIDGNHRVHGPLGKPMIWPGRLPMICQLLRDWGFQPTPTEPQFVSLRPGGAMAPIDLPDPEMPDPASVTPVEPLRERNLGSLLDEVANAPGIMAVPRALAIRAMSAAFDKGASHAVVEPVDPAVSAAMAQLRDHQQQASEDGSMVTVSRQAVDEVVAFVSNEEGRGQ